MFDLSLMGDSLDYGISVALHIDVATRGRPYDKIA